MGEYLEFTAGAIFIGIIVLYYVIKQAVRNGIDESELGQALLKERINKKDEK